MKKLLLFATVLVYCAGVFAQQSNKEKAKPIRGTNLNSISITQERQAVKKFSKKGNTAAPANINSSRRAVTPVRSQSATEYVIGSTTYDQQTNGTISSRFVNNGDNTLSAVWIMSHIASPWSDRGSGYNYYDGSSWATVPLARIEPIRTGYTNIAVAASGEEIALAHSVTDGLAVTSRPAKGTGTWTTDTLFRTTTTDLWPKITAGGANGQSFHAVWQGTGTASGPIFYSNSTDNGATWSSYIQIPGLDTGISGNYRGWSADTYSIDSRGDVVAVVAGDLGMDLVLMKSLDNGATWTKTIVDSFPIPYYDGSIMNTDTNNDGMADTLFSNTGEPAVVIDNNNVVHIVFPATRVIEDVGATGLSYFFTFNMYYWNDNMLPNQATWLASPPDLNGDTLITLPTGCNFDPANYAMGYYAAGIREYIQSPTIGVDAANNLFVCYEAIDELSDTSLFGQCFVHPYLIKSTDGGANWTNSDQALDVVLATQPGAVGEGYDGVYACMARHVDNKVHLIYQRDFAPGTTLSGSTTPNCESGNNAGASNDVIYFNVDTADIASFIPTGVQPLSANIPSFTVFANYPNPFNGKTSFDINMAKSSDVSVEVSNMLGEVVSSKKYSNLSSGVHTLTIDGSKFSSGIYTFTVKAGNDVVTSKMTVR